MAITIKDIAKQMGLSVSSISKALNDKDDISEKQKEKVRAFARKLGYRRNEIAKRLVTQKSNSIGLFIFSRSTIKDSENVALKYLKTLLNEVEKRGYDIVLFSIDTDLTKKTSYIDMCYERQVEGAVFIGLEKDDPHIAEIQDDKLPVIIIEYLIKGNNTGCIIIDNEKGIKLALDYLFDLGHTDIGFIKGFMGVQVSNVRYNTYKKIMKNKNLYNENFVFNGDFSLESGYNIGLEIGKINKKPTAILASNDLMGIGLIRAFKELNISVPGDISIIGYDNFEITKYVTPKLTTVSQDFYQVSIKAAEILFDMISRKSKVRNIIIQPELILRESCSKLL